MRIIQMKMCRHVQILMLNIPQTFFHISELELIIFFLCPFEDVMKIFFFSFFSLIFIVCEQGNFFFFLTDILPIFLAPCCTFKHPPFIFMLHLFCSANSFFNMKYIAFIYHTKFIMSFTKRSILYECKCKFITERSVAI